MNTYVCTECRRPMGRMVDRDGQPDMFLCPHTRRPALAVQPGREVRVGDLLRRAVKAVRK